MASGSRNFGIISATTAADASETSEGFTTAVLPAAIAEMSGPIVSMNGSFHAPITSVTPSGSRRTRTWPGSITIGVDLPLRLDPVVHVGERELRPVETGVPDGLAKKIQVELHERGLGKEPVGVDMADLVTLEALARAGIQVVDGSRVMLEARKIKTADEIALLDHACGIVDAVYEEIYEMLRPGVHEHQIVARAQQLLFEMGSEQVEAINAVSGDRCNPHPHVFLTGCCGRATRPSSTSSTPSWATAPATTARSTSAASRSRSSTRTSSAGSGWTP